MQTKSKQVNNVNMKLTISGVYYSQRVCIGARAYTCIRPLHTVSSTKRIGKAACMLAPAAQTSCIATKNGGVVVCCASQVSDASRG